MIYEARHNGKAIAIVRGNPREARAVGEKLAARYGTIRLNPARLPRVGEVWHGLSGDRCRILKLDPPPPAIPKRVTVLQLDTGHRVTSEIHDFLASYKPPRELRYNRRKKRNVREPGRMDPSKVDQAAARELELFIDNDADLYRQQTTPILKNLWRKMVNGTYDFEKSVKLLGYLVENGGKKYAREFSSSERDWTRIFNPDTREYVARVLADNMRRQLEAREFDFQQVQPAKRSSRKAGTLGAHAPKKKNINDALAAMYEPALTSSEWVALVQRAEGGSLRGASAQQLAFEIVRARRGPRSNPFPSRSAPFVVTTIREGTRFFISNNAAETATDIPELAQRYPNKKLAMAAAKRARRDFGWGAWFVGRGWGSNPRGRKNPTLWSVTATRRGRQVPTFLLNQDVQGFLSDEGAERIAHEVVGEGSSVSAVPWRTIPNPGRLAPGTRVSAVVYGQPKQGTVVKQDSDAIVWVRWDGKRRSTWMHAASLTVIGPGRNPRLEVGSMWTSINFPRHIAKIIGFEGRSPDRFVIYDIVTASGRVISASHRMIDGHFAQSYERFDEPSPRLRRNPKGRALSVPEKHQLKIARDTLKMRPEFARIMGGPTIEEAREIIHRLTGKYPRENPQGRRPVTGFQVGDMVKYSANFLRSTGMYTGDIPFAKGRVTHIDPKFGGGLATIEWDRPDVPPRVLLANLVKVGAIEHNRRGRRGKRAKKNPREDAEMAARRMFDTWQDSPDKRARVTRVKVPPRPTALAKLGDVVAITYRSNKYGGTPDNPKSKALLYEHRTKRPHPVLAADGSGHIHIVGGKMKPTADGLVN